MCEQLLGNVGPLICVRTDAGHTTHSYESTSVPDGRHDDLTGDDQ